VNSKLQEICFDALLNHTVDNIYFKDLDSRFLLVSRAMATWCKAGDPGAMVGLSDADLFGGSHAADARKDELDLIEGRESVVAKEEREEWPDGRVTWVSTVKRALTDADGRIIGTFGISRGITRRRETEASLERATQRLRELEEVVNRSPAVVFQWGADTEWTVLYVSDNIRQFGCEPADLLSGRLSYAALVHPEDIGDVRENLDHAVRSGAEHYTLNYRLLCPDGAVRYVDELGIVRRRADGVVERYEGLVIDVTERHAAEAELTEYRNRLEHMVEDRTRDLKITNSRLERENERRKASESALKDSETRYRRLLETVTDYVYTVELREGKPVATHHGPGCRSVTGYAPEEYQKHPFLWIDMVVPEDRKLVLRQSVQVLETGEAPTIEHRLRRKDGTQRWVLSSVSARRDADGYIHLVDRKSNMIISGGTPITRAACTYSLFFSTIVEPRTVRAYCTQPESAMARISTAKATSPWASRGSSARNTPSISSATRIAGNDSITSHTRMMKASTRPPM